MFWLLIALTHASIIVYSNTTSFDTLYQINFTYPDRNLEVYNITYNISLVNNYCNIFSVKMLFVNIPNNIENSNGVLTVANTSCGYITCPGIWMSDLAEYMQFESIGQTNVTYHIELNYRDTDVYSNLWLIFPLIIIGIAILIPCITIIIIKYNPKKFNVSYI